MEKQMAVVLEDRLIAFGVSVVKIAELLPANDFGKKMRDQLSRSGPAPAQNYGEARAAESRKDFVHKMKICLKELRETYNSLRSVKLYIEDSKYKIPTLDPVLKENNELISIFVVSINTANKSIN